MRSSQGRLALAAAYLLSVQAMNAQAQDGSPPVRAGATVATSAPVASEQGSSPKSRSAETSSVTTVTMSPDLERAIDRLPSGFRGLAPLETLRQQKFADTVQDRRPLLWEAARDISGRITTETAGDQLDPLVNVAAQLAAQLYHLSQAHADQDWGAKALEVLSQLEQRLTQEFPNRLELAAIVGLERIKIQVIPKPGGSVDDYWVKAPAGLNAFLERYPNTTAAAQAAWLMGDACETAQNTPPGLPTPAVGQFREPTHRWYHVAVEQAPDSLWGKLARGCLNRLNLVGQTLEISGTSLVGRLLSLESFRGKPTVVVFFRPSKSSWGAVENPGDFAEAVRARGFEVLGVHCHSPTSAPDEIDRIAKPNIPPAEEPADRMPVIEDAVDVDSSYSVRFGITTSRLFVRVDETGKVMRTALTEIKDLDEFLRAATDPPVVVTKSDPSAVDFPLLSLQTAIEQLPEAFGNDPANSDILKRLTDASRGPTDNIATDEQREHLLQRAKDAAALIVPTIPQEMYLPLARHAARYLTQLYRDSHDAPDWQAKALAELERLETRLAREFPTRIDLASQVGIERLWCRLYSLPPERRNEIDPDSSQITSEFVEQYPHTAAAAQAAYLAATQYERWTLANLGPNYRPRDDTPEMDEDYFQQAVEQSPNSIWGKAAAGALRRIRLVGQTLEVSGKSIRGKPFSLEQFRGKPAVVVFFRPGKSSWGAAENPGDFADAVRQRGVQVLSVLCHSPTAAPDEIDKFLAPKTPDDGPQTPVIIDTDDVDTSDSVRYGLTVQRLFVLVDETGKVIRTATDQVKDIDDFLGLPADLLTAIVEQPADAAQTQERATQTPTERAEPPGLEPSPDASREPVMKVFHLQNGVAADYSKLLQDIFTGTKLTADPRTNSIIAAGEEQDLQKIEALLLKLDEAKSRPGAPNGSATAIEVPKSQRRLLAFTARWSSPCQQILPVLRSIADLGAPIQFVDVDREPELAKRHQITSIPVVIVEEDGREVERLVGSASRQKLEKLILGRVVTSPDAPAAPGRSAAAATSDDPFAEPQGSFVPVPSPSRSKPPGLLTAESRAVELAGKVRELSKTHGSEHPDLIAARQQLERTLTEALELKLKSEQQQVATLEQRLARLKSQLEQRKAVQSQIVQRRMRELLENPVTDWDALPDAPGKFPVLLGAEVAPGTRQLASPDEVQVDFYARDQITVDLYATDGIYQNQKLLGAVVAPLNKIPQVVVNVRMVPGDGDTFVFAIVHDPSQRLQRETQQSGKESATRQAISGALNAGRINDVRWEGAIDFVPSRNALPTEREAAPGAAKASAPNTPPARKPAESLESSARLNLALEEAQADVRETEQKLTQQVKLHAKGVVTTAELTDVQIQRDRAVRRRQVLLDEYAATVKDLEFQVASAKAEYEGAVTIADQTLALFHLARVSMREVTDANVRRSQADLALKRLQNRLELLRKTGDRLPIQDPSTNKPLSDSTAPLGEPTIPNRKPPFPERLIPFENLPPTNSPDPFSGSTPIPQPPLSRALIP